MKLDAIKLARIIRKSGKRAVLRFCDGGEPIGHCKHGIVVVHPDDSGIEPAQQRMILHADGRAAVFPHRRGFNAAAKNLCDILHPIADAQHGHTQRENAIVAGFCSFGINAIRPAG